MEWALNLPRHQPASVQRLVQVRAAVVESVRLAIQPAQQYVHAANTLVRQASLRQLGRRTLFDPASRGRVCGKAHAIVSRSAIN
jgi:hypothetical protein